MKLLSPSIRLEKEDEGKNFWSSMIGAVIVIALCALFWPWAIPFGIFEFWHITGWIGEWLGSAWPFLVWAASVTTLLTFIHIEKVGARAEGSEIFFEGIKISAIAGIAEEIGFRWILFLAGIVGIRVSNWIFGGFMDAGLIEWLHINAFGPLADWTTFGYLKPFLFHEYGWYVGAGMLATNATFRDGHKYQGLLGYINSWFLGMFFFWCMFTYGLLAAISVHFFYDIVCFTIPALIVGMRNTANGPSF